MSKKEIAMNTHTFEIQRILSATPHSTHLLKVISGRAWITTTGEMGQDNPDHVLLAGECLQVQADQQVVIESWPRHSADGLTVKWSEIEQVVCHTTSDSLAGSTA